MNIGNGDINIANVSKETVVEKVYPAQQVSSTRDVAPSGNNVPADAATLVNSSQLQQAPDTEKMDEAVRAINENMQVAVHELHFSVDEGSGQIVVKVMNLATNEVIRQIPNEEVLNIARGLAEGAGLRLLSEYI